MDSTADDDPAGELLELTRRLRGQLVRYAGLGAWAAPGDATARPAADAGVVDAAGAPIDPRAAAYADPATVATPASASTAAMTAAATSATPAAQPGATSTAHPAATSTAHPTAATMAQPPAASTPQPTAMRPMTERAVAPAGPLDGVPDLLDDERSGHVASGRRSLAQLREEIGDCKRCKLGATRKKLVFGVGAEDAPLMFVGEAPGEQEDKRGEPFVGPAGELLDKMIEAMGWTRQTVYITNILMSRPPNNRNPQSDEIAACLPFLNAKIATIAPRIIVALGRPSANTLLGKDSPISALRGKFHDRNGVKVMPTFHPAYLLREPDKKREAWSDLKLVMTELARLGIQAPRPPKA